MPVASDPWKHSPEEPEPKERDLQGMPCIINYDVSSLYFHATCMGPTVRWRAGEFLSQHHFQKETASGHLKYKVLRNELKDVLVKKTVEEKKRGYTGEFLPLETYRLRGFDVKKIEELAQKEVHPILGDTYRIDIKRFSEDFIEQSIEESLTQVEKTVKRNQLPEHMRPQPKKKAKAAPKKKGQGKDPEGEAVEEEKEKDEEEENKPAPDPVFVDLMAMESDSDVEVTCQFIFTGLVITCL